MSETDHTRDVFDFSAPHYQEKFMDQSHFHHSFDLFLKHLPKGNNQILEVACGPGNITRYLLQKNPDLHILGTDLAPKMIELARINNPSAEFQQLDARKINQLSQRFNALVCGFGLPYLTPKEVQKFISDAAQTLDPEGLIFISTMEGDDRESGSKTSPITGKTLFIHYHQANHITRSLDNEGFQVLHLSRQSCPHSGDTDLIVMAKLYPKI